VHTKVVLFLLKYEEIYLHAIQCCIEAVTCTLLAFCSQAAREAGPKASSTESLKRRNRRKSNQQPRPSNEGDVVFPNAAPVTAGEWN